VGLVLILGGVAMMSPLAAFALPGILAGPPRPISIGPEDYLTVIAVPAAALIGLLASLSGLALSVWPRKRAS
jgi:hypothetical protein